MRTLPVLLVTAPFLYACRSADSPPSGAVMERDSAGVHIVTNRLPDPEEPEVWTVDVEPRLTIGVLDGPEEYQLFGVAAAARLSNGDLAVVNGGTRDVRLYAADGTFRTVMGGPGQGPGEFRYPTQITVGEGDTVVVWDNPAHRINRFAPDGRFVEAISIDRGAIAGMIQPPYFSEMAEVLPDGDLLVHVFESSGGGPPPVGVFRPGSGVLRMAPDLGRVDTVAFFGGIEQMVVETGQDSRPRMPVVIPYARRTTVTFQGVPTRVCIGRQDGPAVRCVEADGSEMRIRWNVTPVPVVERDVDAWRERLMAFFTGDMGMGDAEARRVLSSVTIPEYRPPYGEIVLDVAGNLWVQQVPAEDDRGGPQTHFVFNPDGRWLGSVTGPGIQILEIGDDYLMGVYRDESDVEYLQVFDLHKDGTSGHAGP